MSSGEGLVEPAREPARSDWKREPSRRRRLKVWVVAILCLVGAVATLAGVKAAQIGTMIQAGKKFVPPPESVTSAKVQAVEWTATRDAIGTLVAVQAVTLGSELAGRVREITFDSGTFVKRGAVLVKLDTTTEEAQLAAARADAALAKINLQRARQLRKGESNAPADLDAADARAKQADATVAGLEANIAKKTIRAPFDGRLAIRQVELGQILSSGAPVASLQSVSPIYAEFWLPQQALADVRLGQATHLHTDDTFPGAKWEGAITTINPEVDVATRNVRVRATFPNPDGRLRPGMFANVEVLSPEKRRTLIIPATAVVFAPYGDSVFTIEEKTDAQGKPSRAAQQKFVRLGERRGDFVAVVSGLNEGEPVVSSGAFKLRNGSTVAVNDTLAPSAEVNPHPADR